MSHQRKEKNCLNCGTIVAGRFCQNCGQENVETRESFWALMKDFVFDILHFDGKFFRTVGYLFARPGLVARQYAEGKRASFLHPIRMYLFTSAVFFLVFFSMESINFGKLRDSSLKVTPQDRKELIAEIEKELKLQTGDSTLHRHLALLRDTTRNLTTSDLLEMYPEPLVTYGGRSYRSVREYDSIQSMLPENEKDGWFRKKILSTSIRLNEQFRENPAALSKGIGEHFLHRLPYLLFLSLPFFALILKLLYVRRKNFYYSDHAVFTLYHYVFSFIILLLFFGVTKLTAKPGWSRLSFLNIFLILAWPAYLLMEMKNFYRQGWGKTLGKFLLLNFFGIITLILLFLVFFIVSIIQL